MLPPAPADHPTFSPLLPHLRTSIPGPGSQRLVETLARYECPAITARRARRREQSGVDQDPVVWSRAAGANVWDADDNRFVDLTAAFAVMGVGHGHPAVVAAARAQADLLIHGMGDVFPNAPRIHLMERLAQLAPGDLQHSILALTGAGAVEAALKTAAIATGRPGVIAFHGAYHGLGYGALAPTAYKRSFREPFIDQLNPRVTHVPFPGADGGPFDDSPQGAARALDYLAYLLDNPATGLADVGAVLVEPIQGRGGELVAPDAWLQGLRALCDKHNLLLIFDEIYTGFGRTGRWFACQHADVTPDLLCVGKALGGGAPVSAVIGTPEIMARWGQSTGEAIHTSTFLGNPLACAMALAALQVLEDEHLVQRAHDLGAWLRHRLDTLVAKHPQRLGPVRGRGLMLGLPVLDHRRQPDGAEALRLMGALLQRGFLILPSGVFGNVLALAPPFVISTTQLDAALDALDAALQAG